MEYGHDLDKIKYDYTIDQVYLFFDKCRKSYYDSKRLDAFIAAHSNYYTGQAQTKSDASRRKRSWENFIKSLDYEALKNSTKKKTVGNFKALFSKLGIKVKKPTKEGETE